jgi:hypothetical protein
MASNISDRRVSPLRARMVEDMTVRGFTEKTRQDYVRLMTGSLRYRPSWCRSSTAPLPGPPFAGQQMTTLNAVVVCFW